MTDATERMRKKAELIEKLAAIEHERWSDWHIHSVKNETVENVTRWNRQAITPYEKLSESEKESDRREVHRYWKLIEAALLEAMQEGYLAGSDDCFKIMKQQIRDEALEEAAFKIEAMDHCDIDNHECTKGMSEEIRSLKSKGAGK